MSFYMPSDSGEKVTLGITTLLSMTVFLMVSPFFFTSGVSHLNVNFCRRYSDGSEQNINDLRLYFKTLPFPVEEYMVCMFT